MDLPGPAASPYAQRAPGFNIWTLGFPPNERRQREYTAQPPNRGYAEFRNSTAPDYNDASLTGLAPGEKRSWIERMFAAHGLKRRGDIEAQLSRLAAE